MFYFPNFDNQDYSIPGEFSNLPKIFLLSGKGGTGKTTITASLACHRANTGKRVLVFSVDPAHSLGDALGIDLSDNKMHQINGLKRLFAMEPRIGVESKSNGRRQKRSDESDFQMIDGEDLGRLLGSVFLPVSEELNVIKALGMIFEDMIRQELDIDEVYIDGAPTGHFLRVLSFPEHMNNFLGKLLQFQSRFKALFSLSSSKRSFHKNQLILTTIFKKLYKIITSNSISTMSLVTIPETMSLMETERAFRMLRSMKVSVKNLIINKVHQHWDDSDISCKFCRQIMGNEDKVIKRMENEFKGLSITKIPLFNKEINGVYDLLKLSNYLLN
ncbi:MAG: ArsA family ATPase [Promethearchaeota archaeon]